MSIQVSLSGLSFCILNSYTKSISYYKNFSFPKKGTPSKVLDTLTHVFNTETVLKQPFKTITVVHENELSTLVPKSLFNEEHLADYLKFNAKILRSDFITYDEISANESVNIYVPYININNYLFENFGEFEFKHFSTIVLENILNLEKNATNTKMYAHICNNHFEIIVVKNGQLQLFNTFEYSTKEDFIYYLLFTAEQLQLNPEAFQLVLLGNVSTENELFKIAYTYVRNVSVLKNNTAYTLNENVDEKCMTNFVLLNSF
ncbi:DUF3822 family protein [Pontimicrobium aquaticum]|uniref:DUF3822 family protein n=1 Tax=Pontimicrobium aquaticum TaxID=2565367 RepID=UPI001EF12D07|nr:DUF3822 family protein [Pontimicrobium aquaticum]